MSSTKAVTAIILALVIGYIAGYLTPFIRFPLPTQRAEAGIVGIEHQHVAGPSPITASVTKARALYAAGKPVEAQKLLQNQLLLYPQVADAQSARELLGVINTELFFSSGSLYGKTEYTVERGDTLSRISKRLKSTPEMIMRANSLDSVTIHPGDRLIVPDGNFTLTVDLPKQRVVVHHGDGFFKQYPIQAIEVPSSSQPRLTTKVNATTFWKDGERITPKSGALGDATPWVLLDRPGYILYGVSEEKGIEDEAVQIIENQESRPPGAKATPAPNPDIPPRGIALLKDDLAELQLLLRRGTTVTIIRDRP